jgi:hypothetical protein
MNMTTYALEVIFNQSDLKLINQAGEKVVLIKQVPKGGYKVAWVTFDPFQQNTVTWDDDYFLYASSTQPVEGTQIAGWTMQEAQAQNDYVFSSDRTFSVPHPDPNLLPGQYMVFNNMVFDREPWLTFGMAQAFELNGNTQKPQPINAAVVPAKQFARFTPENRVLIFLATNIMDSTVHNDVRLDSYMGMIAFKSVVPGSAESVATELNLSATNKISVNYSASDGKFLPNVVPGSAESVATELNFSASTKISVNYSASDGKFLPT